MSVLYYLGVAEPGEDGWWISFPAIPGTVSAGHTWAQLMDNAQDALLSLFQAQQEDGQAIPLDAVSDPKSCIYDPGDYDDGRAVMIAVPWGEDALHVNLDPDLSARLDEAAAKTGTSRAELLRQGARMLLDATT